MLGPDRQRVYEVQTRFGTYYYSPTMKRRYSAADLGATYGSPFQQAKRRREAAARRASRGRPGFSTVARTRGPYAQGEMKYFDCERNTTNIIASDDWAGCEQDPTVTPVVNMYNLFCPKQGSGINERIGKSCKLHKIRIKGYIKLLPIVQVTNLEGLMVRIILYWDKQTNAIQAQAEDVMTDPTTANVELAVVSPMNINNFGRFTILKDKTYRISWDSTSSTWTVGKFIPFKFNVRFKTPVVVHFNAANGGTIADIIDNSFHIIANTNQSGVVQMGYYCRCCFKE